MPSSTTQWIDTTEPVAQSAFDEPAQLPPTAVPTRPVIHDDGEPPAHHGGNRIAKNLFSLMLSQVATWLVTVVSLIIVPTRLGATEFGHYQFAAVFVAYFTLVGLLGTNTYLIKTIARDRATLGRYVANALVMKLLLTGLLGLAAIALAALLGFERETTVVISVMCITMVLTVVNDILTAGLQGIEQMGRPAAWAVAGNYVSNILGLAVLFSTRSLVAYAVAFAIGAVIPLVANARLLWPSICSAVNIDLRLWGTIVRGSLPFFVWSGFVLVYATIDIPLLEVLSDQTNIGWYTLAYRWISVPVTIASIALIAFLPSMASDATKDHAAFAARANQALRLVAFISMPLAIGTALVADDALPLIYSAEFAGAIPVMQVLTIHIPIVAIDMVLGMALIASDRQKQWVIVAGSAALLNPLFNLSAIPFAQRTFDNAAVGAAVITVFTEVVMMAGALYLRPAGVMDRKTTNYLLRCTLASLVMVPVLVLFGRAGLVVEVLLGVAVFAVASAALRTVSLSELRGSAPRVLDALPWRRTKPALEAE